MDCARNIITANFSGGGTSATTAPLWQWDYGQALCITGIEDLPAAFEVHFSTNRTGGVSTVAAGADGQVTIPNVLLTIGKNLNAWIYLSDAQGEGETEYSILIPVKARPMPETYDAEVSGEFNDVVRQVSEYAEIAQTAADNAGASATAAAASADSAAASASAAESAKTAAETAQGEAEDAQTAAETAAQTATQKAQQTAQDASQTALDAGRAESAAGRAEAAKTGAEGAKTDAETAAQGAAASASAASASATSAGQAAISAGQSATAAAGSATTAENAAQTATTKAGEASASATAANTAKTAAQTAQAGAETAATNAGQSASTATAKAAEAAQSASSAAQSKTDAEAAATRAETAAASLTVDSALSDSSVNPVQNKVITGAITDVKSALDTIETKVDGIAVYPNLANPNAFTTDKYVAPDGSIYSVSGLSYSEKIAVSTGWIIKANHRARFIAAYNGNTADATAGVNDQTGIDSPITYTVPEGITDLIFTFKNEYLSDLIIYVYDGVDYGYIPYGEVAAIRTSLLPVPLGVYAERKNRSVFVDTSGIAFLANTFIYLPVFCSTRKNNRLVYRAQISSLGNFEIGFITSSGTKYNRFVIRKNATTAYTHYDYTQSAMYSEEIRHDLNITAGLIEVIIEELPNAKVKITIGNNGNTFVHTCDDYVKNNTLQPYCYSAYGAFSNYKFTWSCTDLYKDIWFFGDSYMAYSEARWAYYMEEYGYSKNALINSFPGCWSSTAVTALTNLIKYGNPDFAVWALGMNDGEDSENSPSTSWANGRDSFLAVCEANNITPIFCTIPTVPTINHEQKNAWIRSSGYRYIDFAKAVNARSDGTWNTGMLSGDGVHPTINGARALFSEVLLDFPEIMLD